jgi:hypothetical protein
MRLARRSSTRADGGLTAKSELMISSNIRGRWGLGTMDCHGIGDPICALSDWRRASGLRKAAGGSLRDGLQSSSAEGASTIGEVTSDQCVWFGRVGIRRNGMIDHGAIERWRQNVQRDAKIRYRRRRRQHAHAGAGGKASALHIRFLIDGTSTMRAAGRIIRAHGDARGHLAVVRLGLHRGHGKTRGNGHDEHDHRNSTCKLKPHR